MERPVAVEVGGADPATGGTRDAAWNLRFAQLEVATERLGRLPRSSSECGTALLAWMTNQRRALDLNPVKQRRLEALQGWEWDPRRALWEQRAEELRAFVRGSGQLPRTRTSDRAERALAHWLSRQRVASQGGQLSPERATLLAYALKAPVN